jgi:hypothetical protein
MQMPDAVFHLMRNTSLVTCNLSNNVITKIPPKLPLNFSLITGNSDISFLCLAAKGITNEIISPLFISKS